MPKPQPAGLPDGVELQTYAVNGVRPEGVLKTIAIQYKDHAFDVLISDG